MKTVLLKNDNSNMIDTLEFQWRRINPANRSHKERSLYKYRHLSSIDIFIGLSASPAGLLWYYMRLWPESHLHRFVFITSRAFQVLLLQAIISFHLELYSSLRLTVFSQSFCRRNLHSIRFSLFKSARSIFSHVFYPYFQNNFGTRKLEIQFYINNFYVFLKVSRVFSHDRKFHRE